MKQSLEQLAAELKDDLARIPREGDELSSTTNCREGALKRWERRSEHKKHSKIFRARAATPEGRAALEKARLSSIASRRRNALIKASIRKLKDADTLLATEVLDVLRIDFHNLNLFIKSGDLTPIYSLIPPGVAVARFSIAQVEALKARIV